MRVESLESRQLLSADGLSLQPDRVQVWQNGAAVEIDVLANDTFLEGYAGRREVTSVSTGSLGGRIQIKEDRLVHYTPPADREGVETFRYQVDGGPQAEVTVDILSPLKPFELTIHLYDDSYRLDLLDGADFPIDYSGEKRITLVSESVFGADLQIDDDGKTVVYTSRVGTAGQDRFNYIVDDRFVATALVNVNHPLQSDRYEVVQRSGLTRMHVLANDFLEPADPGFDAIATKATARITHALNDSDGFDVSITPDGRAIDFRPEIGYVGVASFRYVVDGRFEQVARVTVQRPVRDDYETADRDGGTHSFDVLANDSYWSIYGQNNIRVVQQITSVTSGDHGGTVQVSPDGKRLLYTPPQGFTGREEFEYVADDSFTARVSVTVTEPVRDDWVTAFVGAVTTIDVLANDFNGTGNDSARITSVGSSAIGAEIVLQDGRLLYRPPEDALTREPGIRRDELVYEVNGTYQATVSVYLSAITTSDWIAVDSAELQILDVLENDHFGSGYSGAVVITDVSQPSHGGVVTIADNGKRLEYRPGSDHETFSYTVDDRFTETVQTRPISRLRPDHAVADQNGPAVAIDVLANDFPAYSYVIRDHGPYTGPRVITSVSVSQAGAVVTVEDGIVRYTPPTDFVGRDSFTYEVDNFLVATIGVNVIRRAADDTVRVSPDSQNNELNVLANDVLGADYTLPGRISAVGPSTHGAIVTASVDGTSIVYTPAIGYQGVDEFSYTLDGQSKATVTVVVAENANSRLSTFESIDEFRDYVLEQSVEAYRYLFAGPSGDPFIDEREHLALDGTGVANSVDHSETNVQVAGVDEDDIVETDGNYIYSLRGSELTIVKSLPADALELVSRTEIEGSPIGMYLHGDRLAVISRHHEYTDRPVPVDANASLVADQRSIIWPGPSHVSTIVSIFDVTDRTSPRPVQKTVLEGAYTTSRRIDDQVFLVLNATPMVLRPETICDDGGGECTNETEQQFRDRVTGNFASLLENALPSYQSFDSSGQLARGGPLLLPEDIYRPVDDGSVMTVVASINMNSTVPGLSGTSGVLAASNSEILATAENLYVFGSHREAVESEPWTRILKFNWDGRSGAIEFVATGDVPGVLLNQFAADEHDGLLRITTEVSHTGTGNFSNQNETALFVLRDNRGVLEFVGNLQNLSPGETVKSVRYFQDRAFVTTFRTIDPLHAIDLSDPTMPRAVGHVALPGFSSYMQFISADRLLTVGTNTATGFGGRAMVTLFDVSELNAPKRIDQYNLPKYSSSQANLDHHAFGWFARHELLAVPISRSYQDRFDDDGDGYAEAIRNVREDALSLLHVGVEDSLGEESIRLRGEITHDAAVMRSVYIGQNVYSIGSDAIRVVDVDEPGTIIDELVYEDQSTTMDPFEPRFGWQYDLASIGERLAAELNLDHRQWLLVAHETSSDALDLVYRHGENHYRFRGPEGGDLDLQDDAFHFVDRWHNEGFPNDVNDDGKVSASDALRVINELYRRGDSELPVDRVLRQIDVASSYADTNDDGRVSAVDVLRIINEMSRRAADLATGESAVVIAPLAAPQQEATGDWPGDDDDQVGRLF